MTTRHRKPKKETKVLWPFNSEYFWRGFWTQMRVQAPIVVAFAVVLLVAVIWDVLK
jgi:hypothetical protein